MSTTTDERPDTSARTGSAYPVPVAELAGRVQAHAAALRAWPSRRQVMTTHRVGRPKAAAVLDTLRAAGFDPTDPAGPDANTAKLIADPEFHAHADHDSRARTDCAYCPGHDDEHTAEHNDEHDDEHDDEDGRARGRGPDQDRADGAPDATAEKRPAAVSGLVSPAVDAPPNPAPAASADTEPRSGRWRVWPLLVISLGAFVSIWGGWVGLGELTGFGPIRLLPGIADQVVINTAITLPIGVEAYAAFALRAWLAPDRGVSVRARRFACWSAIGALTLGAAGQIAYHLMTAAQITRAPWPITAFVSCLPVLVLGCGAALAHLTRDNHLSDHGEHDEEGEDR